MTRKIMLSVAEKLLAIEEIKRVFAARLRCMDMKQWEVYPTLHTEDVVTETWAGIPDEHIPKSDGISNRVVGNKRLGETIRAFLDGEMLDGKNVITSVHHGHTPEIQLTSDTTAKGIWAMEDLLRWTNGDHEEYLHGFGHYHEEYRKVDGQWLISYRSLTRLRVDMSPGFYQ